MNVSLLLACVLAAIFCVPVRLRLCLWKSRSSDFRFPAASIVDSAASSCLLQHHMVSAIYVPPEVRSQRWGYTPKNILLFGASPPEASGVS